MARRCASFAVVLLLASAVVRSVNAADLGALRKQGRLRVLVAEGSPRFFSWTVGTPPGLEREILQGFCRLQRIDLAIVPLDGRAAVLSALVKGRGDVAAGGLSADPADGDVAFSKEILPSRHVVLSHKPGPRVMTLEALRALKVGTVPTSAAVVSEAGVLDLQIGDSPALFSALKAGKVGACVLGVEHAIPAQHRDDGLELGMYLGGRVSLAFALRIEDTQLRDTLNEYIGNLRRSGAWNRLVLTYFGDSAAEILKAAR